MAKRERPEVPDQLADRVRAVMATLPETREEDAWVGVRWRVGSSTVAHLFGGEDQQFRIVLRGQSADVVAFEHLGHPYFRAGWGSDVIVRPPSRTYLNRHPGTRPTAHQANAVSVNGPVGLPSSS